MAKFKFISLAFLLESGLITTAKIEIITIKKI